MDRKLGKDRLLKQKRALEMEKKKRCKYEIYDVINSETGEFSRNYNLVAANKQSLIKAGEGQKQFARRTIKLKKPEV